MRLASSVSIIGMYTYRFSNNSSWEQILIEFCLVIAALVILFICHERGDEIISFFKTTKGFVIGVFISLLVIIFIFK